jgi:hypothetical protein
MVVVHGHHVIYIAEFVLTIIPSIKIWTSRTRHLPTSWLFATVTTTQLHNLLASVRQLP